MKFMISLLAVTIAANLFAADLPPRLKLPPNELLPGVTAEPVKLLANKDLGYGTTSMRFDKAWVKNPKARGGSVKVAILDTGADVNHVWIKDNVKNVYNAISKSKDVTDVVGHGTHCAGTVVECCPDVELYIVKVLDDSGSGSVVDIAHGIDYATKEFGVDVISMSLGGNQPDTYMPPAIARATAAGVIVVVAAGNDGPGANTDGYPARYPECVSTAAYDVNLAIANFSSRGSSVYVAAPGVNIISAAPGNKKVAMSGTSMATPHNAAAAAVFSAVYSGAKKDRPAAYKANLRAVCTHPATRATDDGYGRPDVEALVVAVAGSTPPPPTPTPFPTPSLKLSISFGDLSTARQAELRAAGITEFSLLITGTPRPNATEPPAPKATPVPIDEPLPGPQPGPSPAPAPGGGSYEVIGSDGRRYLYDPTKKTLTPLGGFQPFGGVLRPSGGCPPGGCPVRR